MSTPSMAASGTALITPGRGGCASRRDRQAVRQCTAPVESGLQHASTWRHAARAGRARLATEVRPAKGAAGSDPPRSTELRR
eukprot:2535149-Prymnesium_polylepis.1